MCSVCFSYSYFHSGVNVELHGFCKSGLVPLFTFDSSALMTSKLVLQLLKQK